jgi:glycosyltransferase involved in cell wall biosynthesis
VSSSPSTAPSVTLIVERNRTGHRLFYVRLLASAATARGDDVIVVLSPGDTASMEARLHLASLPDAVRVVEEDSLGLADVEALSHRYAADRVVLPDADRATMDLATRRGGWKGAGALSLLVMREAAQPGRFAMAQAVKGRLRQFLFIRASKLQNVRVCVLKSPTWSGSSRLVPAVDPISVEVDSDAVQALRAEWQLDSERRWFAVVGAVSARKNVDLVISALHQLPDQSVVGLVIAGSIEPETRALLQPLIQGLDATGVAVRVVDRLLTDGELDACVAVADVVVLAHSNEGPSGILGKAAALGTRVVAAGAESLRRDADAFPELASWTTLSAPALAVEFRRVLALPAPVPVLSIGTEAFTSALL